MTTERYLVKVTRNFERNLDEIERFLEENEATAAFDQLLDELTDTVIPNLERLPRIGRPFLDRPASSLEAAHRIEQLRAKLGAISSGGELTFYMGPKPNKKWGQQVDFSELGAIGNGPGGQTK